MAAMGYHEMLSFALKGQQMVQKDNYDNEFHILTIANVQIMLWTLLKCSDLSVWLPISKMAAIAYSVMSLCRKMAMDSQKDNVF